MFRSSVRRGNHDNWKIEKYQEKSGLNRTFESLKLPGILITTEKSHLYKILRPPYPSRHRLRLSMSKSGVMFTWNKSELESNILLFSAWPWAGLLADGYCILRRVLIANFKRVAFTGRVSLASPRAPSSLPALRRRTVVEDRNKWPKIIVKKCNNKLSISSF